MNYQQFEIDFKEKFKDIDEFFSVEGEQTLNGKLEIDNSDYQYDSYGNNDSTLKKVYHFPDYNCYVQFEGTSASYQGDEYTSMKEVKLTTKTIQVYE